MGFIPELAGTTPWWVSGAIDHIAGVIQPEWRILEWGSGGSTLWFAQRVKVMATIEHDERWYLKTRSELAQYDIINVQLMWYADLDAYAQYPGTVPATFDLISVDGRNRAECIRHAIPKLKPGGYLVLDNSERAQYQDAMQLMDTWQRWDYDKTPEQAGYDGWRTTVWRKPC